MSKILKNKKELLKSLKESVEEKEKFHIWNNIELAMEINKKMGHFKITSHQIFNIIRLQRNFRIFKNIDHRSNTSYIFVPSFRY